LAVRVALGASRWQLVRLLTIEVVLVAATALLLAWLGVRVVIAQTAPLVPLAVRPDWRVGVVAATLVAVVVAGSGLLPAWLATRRLGAGRLGADVSGSGRLRHLLVGGQVALSLFLLIAGALLTRSATVVAAAMPPVVGELIGVELDLQSAGHGAASARAFADRLVERLSLEPGVRSAALTDDSLLARRGIAYRLPGATSTWKRDGSRRVSPDWFESLDLRVVAGRSLKLEDRSASVAVVSEALARQIAPGASPVGMTLFVAGETRDTTRPIEVVGVVSDQMLRPGQAAPEPALYVPLVDVPLKLFLFVRTSDRGALLPRMRSLIAGVDPRVPWMQIEPADAILARETAWTSILAWALGALGFVALGLAMAGLYAVLAYLVSLRRREIGIRLAIGAQPAQIVRLIFGQSLRVVGGGIIVGITLAVPAALLMRALIVGVSPFDPVSIAPTVALLIIVAGLASAIPARVAARVDPTITLRDL
jgi:predicted permease